MRFFGYFRSSSSYRCRIAFNLKGVETDFVPVNLRADEHRTEDFLDRNPQGLLPTLDTGEGNLSQSLAIIEWLDETRPEPRLLPADPFAKAEIRAFSQIIACEVHPLQNVRVLKYLTGTFGADQAALDSWCRHWIAEGLAACETIAARQIHGGAFVFGDTPGLADICLVPQMFSADRFGLDLAAYPKLNAIRAACEVLPAFADAHPARQPDAP